MRSRIHMVKSTTGTYCGLYAPVVAITTGACSEVTCQKCLLHRPTEIQP